MSLDKDVLGAAIANTVKTFRPAAGTKVTDAVLEDLWQAIANDIIEHFKANMDIVLGASDISINPGTFRDSTSTLITGQGDSAAVTLSNKVD